MPTFNAEPTPNPNSLKITTGAGPFIEEGLASFSTPEEAEDHPLGRRLFSIAGVENVLIMPEFLTITKGAGTTWDLLMPKIERVLEDYFEEEKAEEAKAEEAKAEEAKAEEEKAEEEKADGETEQE